MSGHSKWSTIKRKKGALDAKRGVIFTRISKDITLAAREHGGNADINPALRLAIKSAKAANMPNANIERAIKKGTGDLPGVTFEDLLYEGYGPGGVAIMMNILTDNKNRTLPEIRHIMGKNGGNLGESGCVNWMFEKKGIIGFNKSDTNEDELMEAALDNGAEDIISDDEEIMEVITMPEEFASVSDGLEKAGFNIQSGSINLEASNTVKVTGKDAQTLLTLMELLEDHEDVQKVYSNFDMDEDEIN
ncbi:MAG: YebC/PmpR family DNA-binding transcriptional regulator [Candidatus Marinimicrobia bacterium]|jgi:YebC/PmpR family DNA-binding regulatory protein|nr:YebC/PmpR family DNA-binding transcriptional regulator [Candidatus Neomarinimicrobiota bacterium]MBT3633994.1 YebC/PmpR family DNA-binding transcriptional regulator [Candidatus Neomarinimicrobiota bacterium]MBT3683732.1 YebC/PmpR family DNA-binding transcriptional regulator [Candidatus Neomarinimicrobiota bacterium]MBT3760612.1 YebC/PmpR family DNA-binding transcriptional regulator [Candidatus Neomarinimicrobiota bacterium]MBT3895771.1 YebC/PmpR family DNA-binding transcriptional regulator [